VANSAITSRPAFDTAAEIIMIGSESLTRGEYLRIRRAARGLSRAVRSDLNAAYDAAAAIIRCNYTHGATRTWHLAMAGDTSAWLASYRADAAA